MSTAPRFIFSSVLFFGRSIDEYRTMFNFDPAEFTTKRILDCAAGPAALAAHGNELKLNVVACDPLYELPLATLRQRADDDAEQVRSLQAQTMELFDGTVRRAEQRRSDMNTFLSDFESGKAAGRYVPASLPHLPFEDNSFDLTLCGNLLFLYSDTASGGMLPNSNLDYAFHFAALRELSRVTTGEVRIYPLVGPEAPEHHYVAPLCQDLKTHGINCTLTPVPHRDIKTATEMLVLTKA